MRKVIFICISICFNALINFAQDDQNALLKSIFSEAGNSYKWSFELISPKQSNDLKYQDENILVEFIPMDEKQLEGPYLWSFWFTNNLNSNIEINWEKSFITSTKGTNRKVYHGDMKSISSLLQKNTIVQPKQKIGDAVVPKESVKLSHHKGYYNDNGQWVEPWDEISDFSVFYGDDFPNEFNYENVKKNIVGKSFILHLSLVVKGVEKNYDFKFLIKNIDKDTSAENPLLDIMNSKPNTNIEVGSKINGNWKGQGIYYSGTVMKIEGDKYYIKYDDGDEEWTTKENLKIQ